VDLLLLEAFDLAASVPCIASLKSTSSRIHISALSPSLFPVFSNLVYPPGLSAILGDISLKSSATASLSFRYPNTTLLEWVESSFDFVIRGSTNVLRTLAFAVVVVILL
jgi:hypothetical protein